MQEGRLTEVMEDIRKDEWKKLEDYLQNKLGYEDYTWGWTFVHFMMSTPKYAPRFRKFFIGLPSGGAKRSAMGIGGMRTVEGEAILEHFRKTMGIRDLTALEKEWHDYVRNGLKLTTERGFEEAGNAAWRNGQRLKAKRFYKEALDKGSRSPEVHMNYAEILLGDEKRDDAVALLRKAMDYDPLNGRIYRALSDAYRSMEGDEAKKEAKRLRLLAREVDPDSVGVYDSLDEEE